MDLTHNNGAHLNGMSAWGKSLRLNSGSFPLLSLGESADAPQLDYLWLVTLYLFVISLRLHSAASFFDHH